jgi:hypothetical protein
MGYFAKIEVGRYQFNGLTALHLMLLMRRWQKPY